MTRTHRASHWQARLILPSLVFKLQVINADIFFKMTIKDLDYQSLMFQGKAI